MYNKTNTVIADSSFYICFLDDISCPSFLNLILSGPFKFLITPMLHSEIRRSENYSQIQYDGIAEMSLPYNTSEILRSFFGRNEALKGEYEIIALAYILYRFDQNFDIILDDADPRQFIEKNMPHLACLMTGTVGFVEECHCDYKIISKKTTLRILQDVRTSKFRVTENIIKSAETRVRDC